METFLSFCLKKLEANVRRESLTTKARIYQNKRLMHYSIDLSVKYKEQKQVTLLLQSALQLRDWLDKKKLQGRKIPTITIEIS